MILLYNTHTVTFDTKKTYLHSISLGDWLVCHNLSISDGKLFSCDITGIPHKRKGEHLEVGETNIQDLKSKRLPPSFLQPRFVRTIGRPDLWQMEIAFEEARRVWAPEAPSRLSSLYLADNSEDGRKMLKETFPERTILEVQTILSLRQTKVDMRGVDEYKESGNKGVLERYWKGLPVGSGTPQWEYLIDGVIQVTDKERLEDIKIVGAKLPGYKGGEDLG